MAQILNTGDSVVVAGRGRVTVERIDVCLRPSTDPAGEEYFVVVQSIEIGEHGPPFTINFAGLTHWAYGTQVAAESIEAAQ